MSLTKAEQIVALFLGGMEDASAIADAVGVLRPYVLRCLFLAGLRQKTVVSIDWLPEKDLPPRVHRDPCTYCNVRADVGCRHNRWAA
jgi:hypothetical protein